MERTLPESIEASVLRFVKWLVLTVACALPLLIPIMGGRAGLPVVVALELGIVTWATGMTLLDMFLAQRRRAGSSRSLSIGFAAWALLQGVVVLVAHCNGIETWAFPYVWSAVPGIVALDVLGGGGRGPGNEPLAVYVLTVSCGLFDFVAGLLVTWLVAALTRPRRSPRPGTAPSPAPLPRQRSPDA